MIYRVCNPRDSRTARVLLMLVVSIGLLAGASSAQQEGAPVVASADRMTDEEAEAMIADIKDVAAEADKLLESFPSPRVDPGIVLEEKEYDPDQIFEWVKFETRWVPYRGILRGAAGVLMDRCGNSLDRSLLLASLLEDAGFETRLARSTLSREIATALLESHSYVPLDDGAHLSKANETDAVRKKQQEVEEQARDLAKLSGLSTSTTGEFQEDSFLADISDHWWVQVKQASDWQDLDPMAPAGASLLQGNEPSTYSADELPEDLYHRLEVRVVIERWEAGRLVEEVPLTHGFAVAEVPVLTHLEIDFLPFAEEWLELDEDEGGLDELEIADSARFWRPTLKVDGKPVTGKWFTASGGFELPTTLTVARKLEAATGALGALGVERPDETPDTHLTAVWLEYETSEPGNRGERVRRELFDLLGAHREPEGAPQALSLTAADTRERGLAMLGRTSSLVLTCTPHPEAVERVVFETWSENRNAFIALVYLAAGWEDERVPIALSQAGFRPVDLLAMSSLRELWSRHRDFTYLDRTNVLSSHLIQTTREGTPTLQFVTDVVINRMGVAPGAPRDPRFVRLEQGVLDTLVETTFSEGEEVHNTFRHFAERSNGFGGWIAIAADPSTEESLRALPGGDRTRIRSAIRNGNLVVASPIPYTFGDHRFASWWHIDPSDGTTLGIGYRGWGVETSEDTIMNTTGAAGTREVAKVSGRRVTCKAAEATVEIVVSGWLLQYDSLPPEKRALIDKIEAMAPDKMCK